MTLMAMATKIAGQLVLVATAVVIIVLPRTVKFDRASFRELGRGPALIIADHHLIPHDVLGLVTSTKEIKDATGVDTKYVTGYNLTLHQSICMALGLFRNRETVSTHIGVGRGGTVGRVLEALTTSNVIIHLRPDQRSTGLYHILRQFSGNAYVVRTTWDRSSKYWNGDPSSWLSYLVSACLSTIGSTVTFKASRVPRRPANGETAQDYMGYMGDLIYGH